jgi:NADPH-dependent 2,4-dienoyl-CoA reductase/sulfur reductase-like enzyme
MTKSVDFLLIGGGLASATAAETLRKEGAEGKIAIISAENSLPYHRPPLSKHFLLGKQKKEHIFVLKESYYREKEIDVALGTKALAVDPESKIVKTDKLGNFTSTNSLLQQVVVQRNSTFLEATYQAYIISEPFPTLKL